MNQAAADRLKGFMKARGLDAALLTSPYTITWLTGYAPPIQTGPSPFEAGPAICWVRGDEIHLLVSNLESGAAGACGVQVSEYIGYTIDEPLANMDHMAAALVSLLKPHAKLVGSVGIEGNGLAGPLMTAIASLLPEGRHLQSLDGTIDLLRAVKTEQEITKLRTVVSVCDQAQEYVRSHAHVGMSEIELWGGLKAALELRLGARLPVLVDLVAGPRTADIGGPPGTYRFQSGDPVMLDFVARWDGYWGDNTDTHSVGERPAELAKMYDATRQALESGVEAVRPGLKARDLDALMRSRIAARGFAVYPHHSGHGLGASYHEEPRLVPYNNLPLEAGMVIALEPGIYVPGVGGVRLEHVVLVTQQGCEVLTTHLGKP